MLAVVSLCNSQVAGVDVESDIESKSGLICEKSLLLHAHRVFSRFFLRLDGFSVTAGCYAVLVFADNATFLLAVTCEVAFRTQTANRPHKCIFHQPQWLNR